MEGEALGPEKDQCPSVGECQDGEAGEGRWMGSTLLEAGERGWGKCGDGEKSRKRECIVGEGGRQAMVHTYRSLYIHLLKA